MNINELMLDPKFDLEEYIENKDKEIERLNNIINELEKRYEKQDN